MEQIAVKCLSILGLIQRNLISNEELQINHPSALCYGLPHLMLFNPLTLSSVMNSMFEPFALFLPFYSGYACWLSGGVTFTCACLSRRTLFCSVSAKFWLLLPNQPLTVREVFYRTPYRSSLPKKHRHYVIFIV